MTWKKLPIENLDFRSMTISGNGKRCQLSIKASLPEVAVCFEMTDPTLSVEINGRVTTKSFNYGDTDLGINYLPLEELVISAAEIDYPGDDEEWFQALKAYEQGLSNLSGYVIRNAKISLTAK